MLHHVSIAVENTARVAGILAEVMGGQFFDFPVHPNSYIVVNGDQYGTAIEVLPANTAWVAGEIEAEVAVMPTAPFTPTHVAMSVPISLETIKAIGVREGWLVRLCDRGPFQVVELWLENRVMVELLPEEIAAKYLGFMTIANLTAFAEQAKAAAGVS
ncbi:MAG: hypothetical protein ICV62_03135 [Cyanobacteria bacterium Co-bin13]|nr:hypothetical protein [Cyanobacteria bacterium Co-bin13]